MREGLLIGMAIGILSSLIAAILYGWLAKKMFPAFRDLWAGVRPLRVGDTVSWNDGTFLVMERSGHVFSYRYKLLDAKGVNPWLLPQIPSHPELAGGNALPFWYAGNKGRCYLKKTGHPKSELRISSSSRC